ncbi:MAG: hypothetical protein Kow002_21830 [Anaerolineales bacterium]
MSTSPSQKDNPDEPVWTYRGYSIKASEFVSAMVHLFRAEVSRSNVWRTRLDTTTNWAVVATGATLSIAFSQAASHHAVIILNTFLVTLFLYIEARRYRYYELWSYRVRLMETDFYAAMLVPPFQPAPDWAESLAENLLHPRFPISLWEAFGRRLRRNYFWLFIILALAWLAKLWLFPVPAQALSDLVLRASVGPVQGWLVLAAGFSYFVLLLLTGLFTVGMTQATGEVLPRFVASEPDLRASTHKQAWYRPKRKRQQLLALVVTNKHSSQAIADSIIKGMKRGVTCLDGKGMYTGDERQVLMCGLTMTEIHNLKTIVADIDENAFVITTGANEILGKGFLPIEED